MLCIGLIGFFEVLKFCERPIFSFHDFIFTNKSAKSSDAAIGQPYSWFFPEIKFQE